MPLGSSDPLASHDMPDGSIIRSGAGNSKKIKGPNMEKAAKLVAKAFVDEQKYMQRGSK